MANVRKALKDADSTTLLLLKRQALTADHLLPIAHALQHQQQLKEVHLQENLLRDTGVEHLLAHLKHCRQLTHLNLSCNKLSGKTVEIIAKHCQEKDDRAFQVPLLWSLYSIFDYDVRV